MDERQHPALLIDSAVTRRVQEPALASIALGSWSLNLVSQMQRVSLTTKNGVNWEEMMGAVNYAENFNAGSVTVRRAKHVVDGVENVQNPSSGDSVIGEPEMEASFGVGEVKSLSGFIIEQPIENARALVPKFVSITRQLGNMARATVDDMLQATVARGAGVGGNLPIGGNKKFYKQTEGAAADADRDAYEAAHHLDGGFSKFIESLTMRKLNGERQNAIPSPETIFGTWSDGSDWQRGTQQSFDGLQAAYTKDNLSPHVFSYGHFDALNMVLSEQETYRFQDTARTPFEMAPFRGMPKTFIGGVAKPFPMTGWAVYVHNRLWLAMKEHPQWKEFQKDAAAAEGFDAGFYTGNIGMFNGFSIIKSNAIPVFKRGNVELARNYLLAKGAVVCTAHSQRIPESLSAMINPQMRSFMDVPVPVRTFLYKADKEAQRTALKWCLSFTPHVVGWTDTDGAEKGKNPATGVIIIESPFKPTA